ncbi:MAG: hypothetical protein ABIG11_05385 [bacterium]
MTIEKKWIFWAVAAAGLTVAAVPSVILYNAASRYLGFLGAWNVGVIRPAETSGVPPQRERPADRNEPGKPPPEVRFVKFRLMAPAAKSIKIAADFNKWTPDSLPMTRLKDGSWETLVPLPHGCYNYVYVIDGAYMIDPRNPRTGYRGQQQTSVITVK